MADMAGIAKGCGAVLIALPEQCGCLGSGDQRGRREEGEGRGRREKGITVLRFPEGNQGNWDAGTLT
jgi:hypothetical protein